MIRSTIDADLRCLQALRPVSHAAQRGLGRVAPREWAKRPAKEKTDGGVVMARLDALLEE